MRAAKHVRFADRREPPAFAPVILLAAFGVMPINSVPKVFLPHVVVRVITPLTHSLRVNPENSPASFRVAWKYNTQVLCILPRSVLPIWARLDIGNEPRYEEAIPKANEAWKQLAAHRNSKLRRIVTEMMEVTRLSK